MQISNQAWRRLYKVSIVGAIVLGAALGVFQSRQAALAQDAAPQTFIVQAGAGGPGNTDLLMFAPNNLQVHRGDTVTWALAGFHNVHFASAPSELVVMEDVNGAQVPSFNPAIAFPTIESGASYSGGDVNSGIPNEVPLFSLVIDLEPGTYSYLCDIHPGMAGTLTVVDSATAIPSPTEVTLQAGGEIGATVGAAMEAFSELTASMPMSTDGDTLNVQMGTPGAANVNAFFPNVAVIKAGQSVSWAHPEGTFEVHTVAWPSLMGQDIVPVERQGLPPALTVGPALAPSTPSGSSVGADGTFNSGGIFAGQTYTLTFTEPGVYPYVCSLHLGMQGVVVVEPQ
ncbi:MAG: hypothetical protein IT320_09770 [Anaerolineae bacterium]|nr:hypothetical protein [Anaerolineae bacterium]